ncbi:hypothetical protein ACN2XU_21280 [Primorskyibacter sp. 2E107]|uniref:hypothetical protein n=1 Tax=Primorskyibacter sp. 2E107 TaxID=3403458 RepID=UPI003AF9C168
MAFQLRIVPEQRCIVYRIGADYRTDDCLAAWKSMGDQPGYAPDFNIVTDLRDVRSFEADYQQLTQLAPNLAHVHKQMPASVNHVILTERDVQFGVARMYQQVVENTVKFNVYATRELCCAATIVSVPEDTLSAILDTIKVSREV